MNSSRISRQILGISNSVNFSRLIVTVKLPGIMSAACCTNRKEIAFLIIVYPAMFAIASVQKGMLIARGVRRNKRNTYGGQRPQYGMSVAYL